MRTYYIPCTVLIIKITGIMEPTFTEHLLCIKHCSKHFLPEKILVNPQLLHRGGTSLVSISAGKKKRLKKSDYFLKIRKLTSSKTRPPTQDGNRNSQPMLFFVSFSQHSYKAGSFILPLPQMGKTDWKYSGHAQELAPKLSQGILQVHARLGTC